MSKKEKKIGKCYVPEDVLEDKNNRTTIENICQKVVITPNIHHHDKSITEKKEDLWIKIHSKEGKKGNTYLLDVYRALRKLKIGGLIKYTINKITEIIGQDFNYIIKNDIKIRIEVFKKLKKLISKELNKELMFNLFKKHTNHKYQKEETLLNLFKKQIIPHNLYPSKRSKFKYFSLALNKDTSELIGIWSGDGFIDEKRYRISLALNRIDEKKYIEYAKLKILKIFNMSEDEISVTKQGSKSITLTIYRESVHRALCEIGKGKEKIGLVPGDKVKNQISITEEIFKSREFMIGCLKGLCDTDGSIHVPRAFTLALRFRNASKPLVYDFQELCLSIGLDSESTPQKGKRGYWTIEYSKKKFVKDFLNIINPEKLKEPARVIYLGSKLIYLNAPLRVRKRIEKRIESWLSKPNTPKFFRYTAKNSFLLKNWVEEEYNKYFDSINNFNYFLKMTYEVSNYLDDNKTYKNPFNFYFPDTEGKYLRKNKLKFLMTSSIINLHLNTSLIRNPLGKITIKYNNKLECEIINEFPPNLRYEICDYLFNILSKKGGSFSENSLINLIIKKVNDLGYHKIKNALNFLRYNLTLIDYFKQLIIIVKEIKYRIKVLQRKNLNKKLTPLSVHTYLKDEFNFPYSRYFIEGIFKILRKRHSKNFL